MWFARESPKEHLPCSRQCRLPARTHRMGTSCTPSGKSALLSETTKTNHNTMSTQTNKNSKKENKWLGVEIFHDFLHIKNQIQTYKKIKTMLFVMTKQAILGGTPLFQMRCRILICFWSQIQADAFWMANIVSKHNILHRKEWSSCLPFHTKEGDFHSNQSRWWSGKEIHWVGCKQVIGF